MTHGILPSWSDHARTADNAEVPDLWYGLAGFWCPALGCSGDRLLDLSGRQHHGMLTNMDAAAWSIGGKGWTLGFDGVDDYVNLGDPEELHFSGSFTLLWYGYASNSGQNNSALLGKIGLTQQRACSMQLFADRLYFYQAADVATYGVYHSAVTRSYPATDMFVATAEPGARIALYQNGKLVGEKTSGVYGSFFNANGLSWCLMSRGDTVNKTAGNVLYAMMFNRALSAAEIAWLAADPFGLLRPRRRPAASKRPARAVGRVAKGQLSHPGAAAGRSFQTGMTIGRTFTSGPVQGTIDA